MNQKKASIWETYFSLERVFFEVFVGLLSNVLSQGFNHVLPCSFHEILCLHVQVVPFLWMSLVDYMNGAFIWISRNLIELPNGCKMMDEMLIFIGGVFVSPSSVIRKSPVLGNRILEHHLRIFCRVKSDCILASSWSSWNIFSPFRVKFNFFRI